MAPSSTSHPLPKPPYDPEIVKIIKKLRVSSPDPIHVDPDICLSEAMLPGKRDHVRLIIIQLKNPDLSVPRPAVYYIHGDAFMSGRFYDAVSGFLGWIRDFNVVFIAVEYRHIMENPFPSSLCDCAHGLQYVCKEAEGLCIDPSKIVVAGRCTGGGLAAALTIMIREGGLPGDVKIMAQCLMSPSLLDDRMITKSSQQFMLEGSWTGESNSLLWNRYQPVNPSDFEKDVLELFAPARAQDLSELPPTWLDIGSADLVRDEAMEYAKRLMEAGNDTELHVWRGGCHDFEGLAPRARLSDVCRATRNEWARRVFEKNIT